MENEIVEDKNVKNFKTLQVSFDLLTANKIIEDSKDVGVSKFLRDIVKKYYNQLE